jgi:hypothetical protein
MTVLQRASLTALATAVAIFIVLIIATRVQVLIALLMAVVAGGAVLAAASRPSSSELSAAATQPVLDTSDPPPQYQALPIVGVLLPSAHKGYPFAFSATVFWLPAAASVIEPAAIAVSEIARRAREITQRRDPREFVLVTHELGVLLADARPDPADRVYARAEGVQLQLSDDDQRRLGQLARLSKEEELWDHRRQHERSKRLYLGEDVLKDAGSAVVWWLARNDDQPAKVAENISVLTQLAHAANNVNGDLPGSEARAEREVPTAPPGGPQTSAEHFSASIDSLGPLDDDARLMLTKQMASLIDRHGYPGVAGEMTAPYDEWPANTPSGIPDDQPQPNDQ